MLAAVLLLTAAPLTLAQTPPPSPAPNPPNTPGAITPRTAPGAAYPGTMSQRASPSTTQSQSRGLLSTAEKSMRSAERVPKADLTAAKRAKVSLIDAINGAAAQSHGDVVSARFELRHGKPAYLIKTFDSKTRQEWLGHIDANTGKLIGEGRTMPLNRLPKEDQEELTAAAASGTTLAQPLRPPSRSAAARRWRRA